MSKRIPAAVKEAAARADAIHKQAYPKPEDDKDKKPAAQQDPPAEDPPAEDPPAEDPPAEDPPTQAKPKGAPEEGSAEYWEQRFRTLQGKYNQEVPRLSADLRSALSQLGEMRGTIDQLKQTVSAAQEPPAQNNQGKPNKSLVTDDEIEEHGEEFVDFLRRLARQEAERITAEVTPKISEIEGRFKQTQAQTAAEKIYATLDHQVEDWRAINVDPKFKTWLGERDIFSGEIRQDMLLRAFEQGDAARVVTFFTAYKHQQAAIQPKTPKEEPAQPQPNTKLEKLAGPRRASGTATPRQPQQRQPYTRDQVKQFYSDVQRGAYKNRPEDKARIEAEIGEQLQQGLIQ